MIYSNVIDIMVNNIEENLIIKNDFRRVIDMNIPIEELTKFQGGYEWYEKHGDGYRIVYFYPDNTYSVGTFCGNIEGFMMDFVEIEPIMDEDDIPEFISNDDLLDRYLSELNDISAVAIYKTDGTCLQKKERTKTRKKN